jgi:hypothetical protein
MRKCSGITQAGERCRSIAITGSEYCHAHHPDRSEARKRAARHGGKRGGRGRSSSELTRLQERFEELAEQVLSGDVERGDGAVAAQLLNGARACVTSRLKAIEQEELIARLERLEGVLQANKRDRYGA